MSRSLWLLSLLLLLPPGLATGQTNAQANRVLQVIAPWQVTSLEPSDTGYIATRMGIA